MKSPNPCKSHFTPPVSDFPATNQVLFLAPAIDLYIWGNVESCITIVAACIPVLRVFVRDFTTSAERYYFSNSGRTGIHTGTHRRTIHSNMNTVTITAGRGNQEDSSSHGDDDEQGLTKDSSARIMQTKEVAIEFQDSRDEWAEEHELHDMQQRSNKSL